MKALEQITHYAGFDWARDHHDVIIVDRDGKIVAVPNRTHGGWLAAVEGATRAAGRANSACVKTNQGVIVEQLLESGVTVYPSLTMNVTFSILPTALTTPRRKSNLCIGQCGSGV